MTILYEYKVPKDLLAKLVRDGRKAHLHSKNAEEFCDNLFNFCITAHALRDWCIKSLNLSGTAKEDFHNRCNASNYLQYCRDIANTTKHFSLDGDRTSSVTGTTQHSAEVVSVTVSGEVIEGSASLSQSALVHVTDGNPVEAFRVLIGTVQEWNRIFTEYGIPGDDRSNSALIAAQWC
ncbi:hypothetical protein [Sessilibacter sp. MAH4]